MSEPVDVDTIRWSLPEGTSDEQDGICNNIRCLSAEVLQTIMKTLDSKELLLCRRINKTWNELADEILKHRAIADWQLNSCTPSYIPRSNRSMSIICTGRQNTPTVPIGANKENSPNWRATAPTGCVVATIDSNGYTGVSNYIENAGRHILSFACHFENFDHNNASFGSVGLDLEYPLVYITMFLLNVLPKMPNLQKLAISEIPFTGGEDGGDLSTAISHGIRFPALSNLKCLEIDGYICNKVARYYRSIINSYGTQLITFKCQYNLLNTLYEESMNLHFENLRALKLQFNFNSPYYLQHAANVFNNIPKLKYLWVQSKYLPFVELLTKLDQVNCPLKEIHFEVDYKGNDEPPGDEMRPAFVDEHFHECLEIKRGIRKINDPFTPKLITEFVDMIPINKKFEEVKVVTLPWLQSSGYWRQDGIKTTLKMFPNLEIIHLTQCNYWTCRYPVHSMKKRYPDSDPDHNKIVTNLITEFKGDSHGLEFFKLLPKLKKVQFFPDCESADRDAFLTYTIDSKGNIETASNGQVPVDLKRFEYPIYNALQAIDLILLDSDDDDDVVIIQ